MSNDSIRECAPVDISDEDVLSAMKAIQGYIDITTRDFREVYRAAYAHAVDRLAKSLKAVDLMTKPVHLIHMEMDLIETATFLAEKGISGAPVVDGTGKIAGVVSEKDFLKKMGALRTNSFMEVVANCLKNKGCIAIPLQNQKVRDIMTSPAITAPEDMPVSDISALFREKRINRIPIVGKDDRPVGIVTRADLVTSYCRLG